MVNAYYRLGGYYDVLYRYEDIRELVNESDYEFLSNLSEKERGLGRILFDYLVEQSKDYCKAKEYETSDIGEFCDQDTIFMIRDEKGVPYNCKMVCDKARVSRKYYNATHDFFEGYKSVQAVQIQKVGEGELETSEGLSKLFEGLNFSTGASICCDIDEQYMISEMTPEIMELQLIARGLSVKEVIEEIKRDYEREQEEERKAREAEEEERKEIEQSMAEESMIGYYESKLGKVTTFKGIKSQIVNNKNLSYTE